MEVKFSEVLLCNLYGIAEIITTEQVQDLNYTLKESVLGAVPMTFSDLHTPVWKQLMLK